MDLCVWKVDYSNHLAQAGCTGEIHRLTDAMLESDYCMYCENELANVHTHEDIMEYENDKLTKMRLEEMAKEMHDRHLMDRASDDRPSNGGAYFDILGQNWVELDASKIKVHDLVGKQKEVVAHEVVCKELTDIFEKKNRDYGNSFEKSLDKHGLKAAVVRMEDKMNRLDNLTSEGRYSIDDPQHPLVQDESVADTLMDLANYAIMTKMWMDSKKNG